MLLFAALEDRRPGMQPSPPGLDLTFAKVPSAVPSRHRGSIHKQQKASLEVLGFRDTTIVRRVKGVLKHAHAHAGLQGSTARRHAVTALGHELASRLRACHVVPASALLAAAVHFLRLAQPASSPTSTSPGPEVCSCHAQLA